MKRSKKHYFQLLFLFGIDVFSIQLNFITRDIAFKFDAFIGGALLKLLDTVKIFLTNNY